MSVVRVNKTQNYTVMSNIHLRDKRMSLKAKGLLSLMLSLPDDWDYSIEGLVSLVGEGSRAVKSGLDELKNCGYLKVTKEYPNGSHKTIEYIYDVYEEPQGQEVQNVALQNVALHNVAVQDEAVQNALQQNTDKQNTDDKILNNNIPPISPKEMVANFTEDDELRGLLEEFIEMRKQRKKPLTQRSMTMALNKLSELAGGTIGHEDIKKQIVEQSLYHCWDSFYEIKQQKGNNYQPQHKSMDEQCRELEERLARKGFVVDND